MLDTVHIIPTHGSVAAGPDAIPPHEELASIGATTKANYDQLTWYLVGQSHQGHSPMLVALSKQARLPTPEGEAGCPEAAGTSKLGDCTVRDQCLTGQRPT